MYADTYSATVLLQRGANVDSKDNRNLTALCYTDDADTLRVLLNHGANANATDEIGFSILYDMQVGPHKDQAAILRLLRQYGARLNAKDRRVLAARSTLGM